jgi:virulence-associated protein VagC
LKRLGCVQRLAGEHIPEACVSSGEQRHAANGEGLYEQPQPGGAPAEGVPIRHEGGVHPQGGHEVILSPRPADWSSYFASRPVASAEFMNGTDDLPVQEREP